MKTRQGFVSNSSSSSFIIYKKDLSGEQIEKIYNHLEEGENAGMQASWRDDSDEWRITDLKGALEFYTGMDNFDMVEFLDLIGFDTNKIEWKS